MGLLRALSLALLIHVAAPQGASAAFSLPSLSSISGWTSQLMGSWRGSTFPSGIGRRSLSDPLLGQQRQQQQQKERKMQDVQFASGWCPDPPSNFTQDLVDQIANNIFHLIDITPRVTNISFIGQTCNSVNGTFSGGDINLCLGGTAVNNGMWRSTGQQAYGLFAADITCPSQANSSGLVTTFYLTSSFGTNDQDEIDFEFLNRYNTVLQINNWDHGKSVYFKNVYLPFDCSSGQKNYAIFWSPQVLIFFVDFQVVAWFPNWEGGPGYPTRASYLVGSFWDGSGFNANSENWCGLRDPSTYWTEFIVPYKNIRISNPIMNAMCAEDFIMGTRS